MTDLNFWKIVEIEFLVEFLDAFLEGLRVLHVLRGLVQVMLKTLNSVGEVSVVAALI